MIIGYAIIIEVRREYMKKSHILTYSIAMVLMLASYLYYTTVFITGSMTLYLHSFHLVGIALILLPFLFELIIRKELPLLISIGFYIFIFMSQIMGSAYQFYTNYPVWDLLAHGFSGALIVFFFAWLSKPVLEKESIVYQLLYLVGVSILVGVLWEIVEFCGDCWFGMNNQVFRENGIPFVGQDAVKDTMYDLIVDLIGCCVGSIIVIIVNRLEKSKKVKDEKSL